MKTKKSKETVLIASVGTRDVQIDMKKEEAAKLLPPEFFFYQNRDDQKTEMAKISKPRSGGEEILKMFDPPYVNNSVLDNLKFPIISPAMDFVVSNECSLDTIILICTDQTLADDRSNIRNWDMDSLFFGKIIEKLIDAKGFFGKIKIINIGKTNQRAIEKDLSAPMLDYGFLYDEMREQLHKALEPSSNTEYSFYVLPQGGIPAINMQMLLNCMEISPQNTRQLYKNENEETIRLSDFPIKSFYRSKKKEAVINFKQTISSFDYFNAKATEIHTDSALSHIVLYAYNRLMGNYSFASELFNEYFGEIESFNSGLYQTIEDLEKKRININYELYLRAKILFKKGDLNGFLSAIITLLERMVVKLTLKALSPKADAFRNNIKECMRQALLEDSFRDSLINEMSCICKEVYNGNFEIEKGEEILLGFMSYFAAYNVIQKTNVHKLNFLNMTVMLKPLRNRMIHIDGNAPTITLGGMKELWKEHFIEAKEDECTFTHFFMLGDTFFKVQKNAEYGIYGNINNVIMNKLEENEF